MVVKTEGFDTRPCVCTTGNSPCNCDEGCCYCEGSGVIILKPYGDFDEVLPDDVVEKFASYWCAGNREHNLGEFIQMVATYAINNQD